MQLVKPEKNKKKSRRSEKKKTRIRNKNDRINLLDFKLGFFESPKSSDI